MKIAHLIGDLAPGSGGSVTAVLGLAKSQAQRNHEVMIVSTDYRLNGQTTPDGVDVLLAHCHVAQWRWSSDFRKIFSRVIQNVDIIHLHTVWDYPILMGARICRRAHKPYLLSVHGMLDRWSMSQKRWKKELYLNSVGRAVLSGAAAVHFTSSKERENSVLTDGSRKTFVLPLGLSESCYENLPDSASFAKRHPDLESQKFILYLGRLHHKKQPELVIQSFARVAGHFNDLCLVMAGSGERSYVDRLKTLSEELGLKKRIFFKGLLTGQAVQEAYRSASFFVLPSLQENFAFSVMEAMAAECPVVVSDQLDLAGEISHANAGIVCTPSVENLSENFRRLLCDDELRRRMGQNGRRLVLEKFTWDQAITRFNAAYEEIIADHVYA